MTLRHALLSLTLLAGTVLGAAGARTVSPVDAASYPPPYSIDGVMPLSPFKVPVAIEAQFVGQYNLQRIDQSLRVTDGYIGIARRHDGSLLGLVYFYGYDQQGNTTSWMAVLSNFHYVGHGKMDIELFSQSGQDLGDSLIVTLRSHGDLIGQLTLDGQTYAGRWQKAVSR
jgi:hypothetical protein